MALVLAMVLVAVAGLTQTGLRRYDTAARYGGEEFVVLCPGTDLDGAIKRAERMRLAIAGLELTETWNDKVWQKDN
jgi:diguanylate cyclase (GGDEF)-like protein